MLQLFHQLIHFCSFPPKALTSEPKSQSPIFPNEILMQIFSHLNNTRDLASINQLNKLWYLLTKERLNFRKQIYENIALNLLKICEFRIIPGPVSKMFGKSREILFVHTITLYRDTDRILRLFINHNYKVYSNDDNDIERCLPLSCRGFEVVNFEPKNPRFIPNTTKAKPDNKQVVGHYTQAGFMNWFDGYVHMFTWWDLEIKTELLKFQKQRPLTEEEAVCLREINIFVRRKLQIL